MSTNMLIIMCILIAVFSEQNITMMRNVKKRKLRRGTIRMTSEMLKKYIGKTCKVSTGQFGIYVKGEIIDVKENWIELQTKSGKGPELINAEFVQSIKVV